MGSSKIQANPVPPFASAADEMTPPALKLVSVEDDPQRQQILISKLFSVPQGVELKQMVQGLHAANLRVILDVVYNHFGPDGNYLGAYAKHFFRSDKNRLRDSISDSFIWSVVVIFENRQKFEYHRD